MRKLNGFLSENENATFNGKNLKPYLTPVFNTIGFDVKDCLAASSGDGGIDWKESWGDGHDIFG